jgi:hypothetical protein
LIQRIARLRRPYAPPPGEGKKRSDAQLPIQIQTAENFPRRDGPELLSEPRDRAEQTAAAGVLAATHRDRKYPMPYTRPIRRFYLTPPAVPTFVVSVLLAVLALLAVYGHIAQLHSIGGFTILLIAYVILLLGTLLRGV